MRIEKQQTTKTKITGTFQQKAWTWVRKNKRKKQNKTTKTEVTKQQNKDPNIEMGK